MGRDRWSRLYRGGRRKRKRLPYSPGREPWFFLFYHLEIINCNQNACTDNHTCVWYVLGETMSRNFYELCYDQYKLEMAEANSLYQKAGVMLVVLSLLGTIIVSLGRIDLVDLCFKRIDVFLFYFASVVAITLLSLSVIYLIQLSYPRSEYKTLKSMDAWQNWRSQYFDYEKDSKTEGADAEVASVDDEMFKQLCSRMAEAQAINSVINEKRRKKFQMSIKLSVISLLAIAIQALFGLILNLQGI